MQRPTPTDHAILMVGVVIMTGPVVVAVWMLLAQTGLAGFVTLVRDLWSDGPSRFGIPAREMVLNSLLIAVAVALLKTTVAVLAAYALIFFRLRFSRAIFLGVVVTLFLPIESRILPTFLVTNQLGLLNSYGGMILPVAASGLGLLVFHQFLQQFPPDVMEAARIDGAGPLRILIDMILPLSVPMIAALFAIVFVLGWNQYMWPIMVNTVGQDHDTIMRGMATAGVGSTRGLALALMALIPPGVVVLVLQRWLLQAIAAGIK